MIRRVGCDREVAADFVLVILLVSANESTLLAQINILRFSQPFSNKLPDATTELVTEPPSALSLVDDKSNA